MTGQHYPEMNPDQPWVCAICDKRFVQVSGGGFSLWFHEDEPIQEDA